MTIVMILILAALQVSSDLQPMALEMPHGVFIGPGDHPDHIISPLQDYLATPISEWRYESLATPIFRPADFADKPGITTHMIDKETGAALENVYAVELTLTEKQDYSLKKSIVATRLPAMSEKALPVYRIDTTHWHYIPGGKHHYFFSTEEHARTFANGQRPAAYAPPFPHQMIRELRQRRVLSITYADTYSYNRVMDELTGQEPFNPYTNPDACIPVAHITWKVKKGQTLITHKAADLLTEKKAETYHNQIKTIEEEQITRNKLKNIYRKGQYVIVRREKKIREGMAY